MRLTVMILLGCLLPAAPGLCADESVERTYAADDRSECMERDMDSARGGCLTTEDGSARSMPPQALPPAPDTTRESPPESAGSERSELPLPATAR